MSALTIAVAATLAPSSALADDGLVARPATVKDSQSITVRWTPRVAADPALFTYRLDVTNLSNANRSSGCSDNHSWKPIAPWKTGAAVRFTVRPTDGGRTWCPDGAGILIRVMALPRTPGERQAKLATAYVGVLDDPATPPNGPGIFHMPGNVRMSVSPAAGVGLGSAVSVAWRTTVKLGRDEAYQVVFAAGTLPPGVAPTCIASLPRIVGRGSPRGRLIRVRMNPYMRQGVTGWCPSEYGSVVIQRVALDAKGQAVPQVQERIRAVGSGVVAFKR